MKTELKQKLLSTFPKLYKQLIYDFECDDGWFDIIYELSEKLEKKNDAIPDPSCHIVASQVKEKFGDLRFYTHNDDYEAREWILAAELKSMKTCEVCGSIENIKKTTGYIKTLCGVCYSKFINK